MAGLPAALDGPWRAQERGWGPGWPRVAQLSAAGKGEPAASSTQLSWSMLLACPLLLLLQTQQMVQEARENFPNLETQASPTLCH